MRVRRVDDEIRRRLRDLARDHLPVALNFRRTDRFANVLWLDPDSAAVNTLVRALRASWPQWPPYGDPDFVVVPHLTIARSQDSTVLDRIVAQMALLLPRSAAARVLSVISWEGTNWTEVQAFGAEDRHFGVRSHV